MLISSNCFGFELPWGTWKGTSQISFKGKITNSQTGDPIETFSVCVIQNGVPEQGRLHIGERSVDLGMQTVKSEKGKGDCR